MARTTKLSEAAFDILFSIPDLPKLIFSWLDPSSLALAAWVCKKWRDTARDIRGEGGRFRLVLADLVTHTQALAWIDKNVASLPNALRSQLCAAAADGGAQVTLQWARENGCEWDAQTCALAARGGHLGLLRWARENGCPWSALTCAYAALNGHLEVLRWSREGGCAWNKGTCAWAAMRGHREKNHKVILPAMGAPKRL